MACGPKGGQMTVVDAIRMLDELVDNKGAGYDADAWAMVRSAAQQQDTISPPCPECHTSHKVEQQWVCERCGHRWATDAPQADAAGEQGLDN